MPPSGRGQAVVCLHGRPVCVRPPHCGQGSLPGGPGCVLDSVPVDAPPPQQGLALSAFLPSSARIPLGYSGIGGGGEGAQAECPVPETSDAGGQRLGLSGENGPHGPSVCGSRCGARRPWGLHWEGHGDNLMMAMNGRRLGTHTFCLCGSAGARVWPRRWPFWVCASAASLWRCPHVECLCLCASGSSVLARAVWASSAGLSTGAAPKEGLQLPITSFENSSMIRNNFVKRNLGAWAAGTGSVSA